MLFVMTCVAISALCPRLIMTLSPCVILLWLFRQIMAFLVAGVVIFGFILSVSLIWRLVCLIRLSPVWSVKACPFLEVFRMFDIRAFGDRQRVPSCSGSRWKRKYHPVVGKDGHIELIEDKPVDLYQEIQSHADSTDLRIIIDRYVNGEVDLIRPPQGGFFDATSMPKTYAEALQMTIDAERDFLSLPVDVREKFGHDYRQYMAQAGTADWYAKLGVSLTPANDAVKEVASDESEQ